MEDLSDELIVLILEYIPPLDVLQSTRLVSRRFAASVQSETFWKQHPLSPASAAQDLLFTNHQLHQCCIHTACKKLKQPTPKFLNEGRLLPNHFEALQLAHCTNRRMCLASTTDHADYEAIEYSLQEIKRLKHIFSIYYKRWWSSKPSTTKDSNEVLLYLTKYPLTVISELRIKPLREPHPVLHDDDVSNNTVFTWKKTLIKAYRLPFFDSGNDDQRDETKTLSGHPCSVALKESDHGENGVAAIERILEGYCPVYEAEDGKISADSDQVLTYTLPPGVVANCVTFTLIGKNHEQQAGVGYYACVETVDIIGIPLLKETSSSLPQPDIDSNVENLNLL